MKNINNCNLSEKSYQDINAEATDSWCDSGWEWGKPIDHNTYLKALGGDWGVLLTPTKSVPKDWFCDMKGAKILGLASAGGQQMPIFSALGAKCTVLDYSEKQLENDRIVSAREGFEIDIIRADMTQRLPFEDNQFDMIFHPVSNCYVEEVRGIFKECYRVLKKGGILLCGLDNGINFVIDLEKRKPRINSLPFNPLRNPNQRIDKGYGVQFSHTMDEQIGGQLQAGLTITDIYEDTNGDGYLHDRNIPSYIATRAIKS